jgi:chromatin segregation and condensation protein Rec8/ScpA/Scc1 (kleisin family)
VYDGPLDLLLDLIRSQDIDVYDIPIAKITAQFLAYVNQLKATDVDVAGEFIYTASLLIHIKSKMLLPRSPAGPDDTQPRLPRVCRRCRRRAGNCRRYRRPGPYLPRHPGARPQAPRAGP